MTMLLTGNLSIRFARQPRDALLFSKSALIPNSKRRGNSIWASASEKLMKMTNQLPLTAFSNTKKSTIRTQIYFSKSEKKHYCKSRDQRSIFASQRPHFVSTTTKQLSLIKTMKTKSDRWTKVWLKVNTSHSLKKWNKLLIFRKILNSHLFVIKLLSPPSDLTQRCLKLKLLETWRLGKSY